MSAETKEAIAGRPGALGSIEVCQFSENPLLRRAGTECLANLATTERGRRLITDSRLSLWLALAHEWTGPTGSVSGGGADGGPDVQLASAALGGLAMALGSLFDAVVEEESGSGSAELAARKAVRRFVAQGEES